MTDLLRPPIQTWQGCQSCGELLFKIQTPGHTGLHCIECDGEVRYQDHNGVWINITGMNQHRVTKKRKAERPIYDTPPPPPPIVKTGEQQRKEDLAFFGLADNAQPFVVQAVYKAFAKRYHPDTTEYHPSNPTMTEINARYGRLKR